MSQFNEQMNKKILGSAALFIKDVERRYQEPVQQILAINKEIATLTNPRNISRARRSGAGAYTQLLRFYVQQQDKVREKNQDLFNKIDQKLTSAQIQRDTLYNEFTGNTQNITELNKLLKEVNEEGVRIDNMSIVEKKLEDLDLIKDGKATMGAVLAVQFLLNRTDKPTNRPELQKYGYKLLRSARASLPEDSLALLFTSDLNTEEMPQGFDLNTKISQMFPIFDPDTEQGQSERNKFKNLKNLNQNLRNHFKLDSSDVLNFVDYTNEIEALRGIVFGRLDPNSIPTASSTAEQKLQFVESVPGLTIANDRVIVSKDATATEKAQAEKLLTKAVGKKNPTFDEFMNSSTVKTAVAGFEDGSTAVAKMEERAAELEERKKGLTDLAIAEGRLSAAEQSVLTSPIFPRPGFRRTARFGLIKDTQFADERLRFEFPEEQIKATNVGTSGVPIVPATINRVKKAFDRANTAADDQKQMTFQELTDVVEGFKRLPEDVQSKFPQQFLTAVYQFGSGLDGKDDTPEQELMRFADAVRSLDNTAITTQTIGEYIADVGKDPQQTALTATADMVEFLNHPDSVGEGSSLVGRRLPVGAVASEFLDTMNKIGEGTANKSQLIDVFDDAQRFAQGPRPEFFDTDTYGRYESVDRFVAAMDAEPGERATQPDALPASPDEPDALPENPFPEGSRKAREFDRIAQDRDRQIINEAEAAALVARLEQDDDLDETEIDRQAIQTATSPSGASLRTGTVDDPSDELAAEDAERRARSERPAITGTDDTMADRVLRDSLRGSDQPAPDAETDAAQTAAGEDDLQVLQSGSRDPFDAGLPVPEKSDSEDKTSDLQVLKPGSRDPFDAGLPVPSQDDLKMNERRDIADRAAEQNLQTLRSDVIDMMKTQPGKIIQRMKDLGFDDVQIENTFASAGVSMDELDRQAEANLASLSKEVIDLMKSDPGRMKNRMRELGFDQNQIRRTFEIAGVSPDIEVPEVDPSKLQSTDVARIIRDEFAKDGFSQNQIQALMATAIQESSLNPLAKNLKDERSHGIFQFNQDRGEGAGIATKDLQNPYFQINATKEAIANRPELSFFRDNPDASPEELIQDLTSNFIRPKDFDTPEVQAKYTGRIPKAVSIIQSLDEEPVQVGGDEKPVLEAGP